MNLHFGIVIPTFNQEGYLSAALSSILAQGNSSVSVVVVDGAQSIDVLHIVESYQRLLDIKVISEPDSGQADAINKGFNHLEADIYCWLNSDDMLMPNALPGVERFFRENADVSVVYGNALIMDEARSSARLAESPAFDRQRLCFDDYIVQPSTFWRRKVWEAVGPLNEALHFVLDWEWWLRASEHYRFVKINSCLSIYRIHAQHKTGSRRDERLEEVLELVERYAPSQYVECMRQVAPVAADLVRLKSFLYRYGLISLRKFFYPSLYLRFGSRLIEDVIPAVL